MWCHECGEEAQESNQRYCTTDGHRMGVPKGNKCEECLGIGTINSRTVRDAGHAYECHGCGRAGKGRFCAYDGHRMAVSKGNKCEACLGFDPLHFEALTIPQLHTIVEWVFDETISEAWFGAKSTVSLGPLSQQVLNTCKRKGWSKKQLDTLARKLSGIDEKTPMGKQVLQSAMMNLTSGSFETLSRARNKRR